MRRPIFLAAAVAALAVAVVVVAGTGPEVKKRARPEAKGPIGRVLLAVEGVSCGSCEAHIREALSVDPAVRAVSVDLGARTVTVEYTEGRTDPKALADRVTLAGYPARYLASGPQVPPAATKGEGSASGCGGSCCAGGKKQL